MIHDPVWVIINVGLGAGSFGRSTDRSSSARQLSTKVLKNISTSLRKAACNVWLDCDAHIMKIVTHTSSSKRSPNYDSAHDGAMDIIFRFIEEAALTRDRVTDPVSKID